MMDKQSETNNNHQHTQIINKKMQEIQGEEIGTTFHHRHRPQILFRYF